MIQMKRVSKFFLLMALIVAISTIYTFYHTLVRKDFIILEDTE